MKINKLIDGKNISENIEPDFLHTYDVIIAGLGSAGAIALLRASEYGLDVLGVEKTTAMGGIGTDGYIWGYYGGTDGGRFANLDIETRSESEEFVRGGEYCGELKKILLEKKTLEHGGKYIYESFITGVITAGNKIVGVQVFEEKELKYYGCGVLIDSTQDADIARMCGASYTLGRTSDRQTQPYSNLAICYSEGKCRVLNIDAGYIDPLDINNVAEEVINSTIVNKRKDLLFFAPQLGFREGPLINGVKKVSFGDIVRGKYFGNPVMHAYSNFDTHSKDLAFESADFIEWTVICGLWSLFVNIPLPYEIMLIPQVCNLIVASRAISIDHNVASAVRMLKDIQKIGEIAAVSAYLCVKKNIMPHDIDYRDLKDELALTGFDGGGKESMLVARKKSISWLENFDEIKDQMKTNEPAVTMWSAVLLGDEIKEELVRWMHDENSELACNSSFVLGILGDRRAIPVIREIARKKDPFLISGIYKNTYMRGCAAIYLLGKLRDTESTELFLEILENESYVSDIAFNRSELLENKSDLYSIFCTFALRALKESAYDNADVKERIDKWFKSVADLPLSVKHSAQNGNLHYINLIPKMKKLWNGEIN